MSENIGPLLKHLRKQLGITIPGMARRTGLHRNTITRIESGETSLKLDHLVTISGALKEKPSKILRRALKIDAQELVRCVESDRSQEGQVSS